MKKLRKNDKLKNKKMNNEVYTLRRKIIGIIYEAKKLVPSLPRIDVKVTENNGRILGSAGMGTCEIWITERITEAAEAGCLALRHVVLHEICHAVFSTPHDESDWLMSPVVKKTTKREQDKAFIRHSKGV